MFSLRISLLLFMLLVGRVIAAPPPLPTINTNNVFNVTNATYGASTGNANNAAAINAAIVAAAAASGGGTVEIPGPGTYLAGPITLKSKVNLQVDAGATLMMLPMASWSGSTTFIMGSSLSDVEISGAGTIDGQGAAWWSPVASSRPNFIQFSKSNRILIQNVTLQNPPTFHLMLKNDNANITIQGITINTPGTSPNTDGMDIGSTNMLIQNCYISDGDDNIEIGGSATAAEITVTNCTFGTGHGVSIGSITTGGVSNLVVTDCTFSGTKYGIRMKSDDGSGGIVQNLSYSNIRMTNIVDAAILIYSYYGVTGTPIGITPATANGEAVASVSSTTPVWRNIVISNVTATVASGGQVGVIWGRTEMPVTNLTLSKITVSGPNTFDLYNVRGVTITDPHITPTGSGKTFTLFNAQAVISNSVSGASAITLDGLAGTNSLALYNAPASCADASIFGASPIRLVGSVLSDSTSLTLPGTTPVDFALGTNAATVAVAGGLTLNSTLNISSNGGFGAGTYTLFSYTSGSLGGTPVLGSTPPGYAYNLTNIVAAKQIELIVISTNGVKPTVNNQPASQKFYVGENVTFTSGASGTAPLAYQWRFNSSTNVFGGTNFSLTLTNLQTNNTGGYTLVVTNAYGAATSSVATLAVALPPQFGNLPAITSSNIILTVTGGLPTSNYVVLAATNPALPVSQWTRLATNNFDNGGNFSMTNSGLTGSPQQFYRLQLP